MTDCSNKTNLARNLLLCGFLSLLAWPVQADAPSAEQALGLNPVQDGVEYEQVAPEAMAGCAVQDIKQKGWTGWEVVAADGTLLRRFADTNGDKRIDLWCYFNFGAEVYRDIDADFNGKADQYRWLGTGGTKWGMDEDEDGSIDRWNRISAEEVTEELIQSLRERSPRRFARLLATEKELAASGLGGEKLRGLTSKVARAAKDFGGFAQRQKAVGEDANWVQFAAPPPGIFPAGTQESTRDVLVYENAVAMFEEGGKNGQLNVGTMIYVDKAWRLVDLPSIGSDGESVSQAGNFFNQGSASMASTAGGGGEKTHALVGKLEEIDVALSKATKQSEIAGLHRKRADLVEELIAAAGNRAEKVTWVRQLVDTMSVAVQSGNFPEGVVRLRKVATKYGKDDEAIRAYADYTAISTEYVTRQTPKAKFEEVQEWYLKSLDGFIDRYPRTIEAAQAMLQIALSKEFEDKEREALKYYRRVAENFRGTDPGDKAAGAVRRLDSIGKRISLSGRTVEGKQFDIESMRGQPVVIHYWATWCEPCKNDMKTLRRLQAQYKGLRLVGINVDAASETVDAFLREAKLPWVQLFEPGGLEGSPLSKMFGVQTLPTMMLLDRSGKVVRHNVRIAELGEELEAMAK